MLSSHTVGTYIFIYIHATLQFERTLISGNKLPLYSTVDYKYIRNLLRNDAWTYISRKMPPQWEILVLSKEFLSFLKPTMPSTRPMKTITTTIRDNEQKMMPKA